MSKNWQEEFDKEFSRGYKGNNWTITLNWNDDDTPLVWGSSVKDIKEDLKDFISSLLSQQRKEVLGKLKPEITDHLTCGNPDCQYEGKWCYHLTDKEFDSI